MALSDLTYTALKSSVADHLAKSNLSGVIPDLIYLAETRIFRRLTLLGMEDVETGTLTASQGYIDLPSGHNGTTELVIGTDPAYAIDKLESPEGFLSRQMNADTGPPRAMTVIGERLYLSPIPDAAYAYSHHYHATPQRLSSSQSTNYVLQNAPDVYLYGALLEAEPYLKNDGRIPVWRGFLAAGFEDLEAQDMRRRWTGGPLVPRAG